MPKLSSTGRTTTQLPALSGDLFDLTQTQISSAQLLWDHQFCSWQIQLLTHSLPSLQVLPVQLVDTGGTNTLTSPGNKQFCLSLSACQEQPNLLKKL